MATVRHWLSYDEQGVRQQGRRKWPWLLLLLLLLAAMVAAGLFALERGDAYADIRTAIAGGEPVAIQSALPALLVDNAMIVYVVDDSGSMEDKLLPLHQALREVSDKPSENSEIALLMFGNTNRELFDFTSPGDAPWDKAIPAFTASSGGTAMFTALAAALDMMPDQPVCHDESRLLFFNESVCRENRIVLMSDGMANDAFVASNTTLASLSPAQEAELVRKQLALAISVIERLAQSDVPVDTIALGSDADEVALRRLSELTGGVFIEAYY